MALILIPEREKSDLVKRILEAFAYRKGVKVLPTAISSRFITPRQDYKYGLEIVHVVSSNRNAIIRTYFNFSITLRVPEIGEYLKETVVRNDGDIDTIYVGFATFPYRLLPIMFSSVSVPVDDEPMPPILTSFQVTLAGGILSNTIEGDLVWTQASPQPSSYRLFLSRTAIFGDTPDSTVFLGSDRSKSLDIPDLNWDTPINRQIFAKLEGLFGSQYLGSNVLSASLANPPDILEFVLPTLTMDPGDTGSIAIRRTGYGLGAVSVQCQSVDQTAVEGVAYTEVNEIVTWSNGDLSLKYVDVESLPEQSGTFKLVLTNATGASSIGSANEMVVTIQAPVVGDKAFKIVSASPNGGLWTAGPDLSSLVGTSYDTQEELEAAILTLVPVGQNTGHTGGALSGNWSNDVHVLKDGELDIQGGKEALYIGFGYSFANRASNVGFEGGRTFNTAFNAVEVGLDINYDFEGTAIHYTPNVYVTGPFDNISVPEITSFTAEPGQLRGDILTTLTWTTSGDDPLYYNVYFVMGFGASYSETPTHTNIPGSLRTVDLIAPDIDPGDPAFFQNATIRVKLEAVYENTVLATPGFNFIDYVFSRFVSARVEAIIYSSFAKDEEGNSVYYQGFSNTELLQRTIAVDPTSQAPIPVWEGDEIEFRVYGVFQNGSEEFISNPNTTIRSDLYFRRYVSDLGRYLNRVQVDAAIYADPDNISFNGLNDFRFNVEGHIVVVPFFIRYCNLEIISDRPLIPTTEEDFSGVSNHIRLLFNETAQLNMRMTVYPERVSFNVDHALIGWNDQGNINYSISPTGLLRNIRVETTSYDIIQHFSYNIDFDTAFSFKINTPLVVKWGPA